MTIPKGKQIQIFQQGSSLVGDIPLILEEPITLNLSSTFAPLIQNTGSTLLTLAGTLLEEFTGYGFSGQFKQQGFQIWKGTEPLSLNLTLNFYLGSTDKWNAMTEVYNPIIKLASTPLPTLDRVLNSILVAPGPSVASAFLPKDKQSQRGKRLSLEIGNMFRIDNVVIQKAEPTFSEKVDDKGYPIQGSVNLDIKSVNIATVEMLTDEYNTARIESFKSWLANR